MHAPAGWGAVPAVAAMGSERAPPDRDPVPVGLVAHPVDLVDDHPEVREGGEHPAGESLHVPATVADPIGGSLPAHGRGIAARDGAEVAPVVEVVPEGAAEVVDVERPVWCRAIGLWGPATAQAGDLGQVSVSGRDVHGRTDLPGGGHDVDAQLRQLRAGVVEDPLLVDLVALGYAVGDAPDVDDAARGRTEAPGAQVMAGVEVAVRGDETLLVVAGPDDLVGVVTGVREGVDGRDRGLDDAFDSPVCAVVVMNEGAGCIGVVDVSDVLIVPDPVGDPDDVVDDVDVGVLVAAQRLPPRPATLGGPTGVDAGPGDHRDVEVAGHAPRRRGEPGVGVDQRPGGALVRVGVAMFGHRPSAHRSRRSVAVARCAAMPS